MNRIASRRYVDGARGQPCKLRIEGVCTGGGEDTVFAHIRDRHTGRSIKASDTSGADACFACHEVFDFRAKLPHGRLMSPVEWLQYALRGLQETLEDRIARGLLALSLDVHREPKPRSRKPPSQRKPVPAGKPMESRSNWPEQSRPMQSRSTFKERTR